MKQQKLRFRVLAFVVIGLLALAGVYGVYSVSTYGSRWISSTRNTRYRSAKSSVIPGDIIDRRGVVVATTWLCPAPLQAISKLLRFSVG